jgi:hypothetical protein
MRKLVMLTRHFIFDPGEIGWTRVSEVDKSMARWLDSMGMEGHAIELMGQPESGIIKITKKEEIVGITTTSPVRAVKEQLARATAKIGGKNGKSKRTTR